MEHSQEFIELVENARKQVAEVSVPEAVERVEHGAQLIDVREDNEWDKGHARAAVHLGKGIIERDISARFPDKNAELILYCGGGFRSVLAADNLQKMGYKNVFSMKGGWKEWQNENAPTD